MLRKVGGWDPYNVTEDADLGIRLCRFGYRSATLPSATYEEAPARFMPWLRQRTRWYKGWMRPCQILLYHCYFNILGSPCLHGLGLIATPSQRLLPIGPVVVGRDPNKEWQQDPAFLRQLVDRGRAGRSRLPDVAIEVAGHRCTATKTVDRITFRHPFVSRVIDEHDETFRRQL